MKYLRNAAAAVFFLTLSVFAHANPININTASANVLAEVIVGVGPGKAAAIVEYRALHGPFTSINGLTKVKGIGDKIVDSNRDKLSVE